MAWLAHSNVNHLQEIDDLTKAKATTLVHGGSDPKLLQVIDALSKELQRTREELEAIRQPRVEALDILRRNLKGDVPAAISHAFAGSSSQVARIRGIVDDQQVSAHMSASKKPKWGGMDRSEHAKIVQSVMQDAQRDIPTLGLVGKGS